VKTLAELQAECAALGITVETNGRPSKDPYTAALREYHWRKDHPDKPLPEQFKPMLLSDWDDLTLDQAQELEQDCHAWIVEPKENGVRSLLHVEGGGVRITSRCVSETTYRLSELQHNLSHLMKGLDRLKGTILDGELVCPVATVDAGSSVTANPLQTTMAILATSPENAQRVQEGQNCRLRFHIFDILRRTGTELVALPLIERQAHLVQAFRAIDNPCLEQVPSFVVGKADVHRHIIEAGGEGTVWKKADQPYEPGRRVKHWIKRKRVVEAEAFVTGFKPGRNGHTRLVGALEFSVQGSDGVTIPVAWVSNWTDQERQAMIHIDPTGKIVLNPAYLGRRALIFGQDHSAKSRRIRHARIRRWLDR